MDYYGLLQISPHADPDTIHRVYRYLAARFHPDNPESGDAETFCLLRKAYDVLSDPSSRAKYDAACEIEAPEAIPLSTSIDFMDNMEGELNRRLAVLALLYIQRRTNPYTPEVPLSEVEKRMGFPRDYLDFTTWYLQKKGFITRGDNSDFTLTAAGVDFVEAKRVSLPVLNKLLTGGTVPSTKEPGATIKTPPPSTSPIILHPTLEAGSDRRSEKRDRRVGEPDRREDTTDRRMNTSDRRVNTRDRRASKADRRAPE
jgi:curved DNA-binding protein CbpA